MFYKTHLNIYQFIKFLKKRLKRYIHKIIKHNKKDFK